MGEGALRRAAPQSPLPRGEGWVRGSAAGGKARAEARRGRRRRRNPSPRPSPHGRGSSSPSCPPKPSPSGRGLGEGFGRRRKGASGGAAGRPTTPQPLPPTLSPWERELFAELPPKPSPSGRGLGEGFGRWRKGAGGGAAGPPTTPQPLTPALSPWERELFAELPPKAL